MEGQTNLATCGREKKEEEKKKRERENKTKQTKQKKTKKSRKTIDNIGTILSMQKPSSLPSLRERSEVLDRRVHWETQETPVAQSHLSASVCITGYRHSGCRRGRQESIFSPGAEPATRLLGRQHSVQCSLRANEPSQLPSKYRFQVNTLNSAQRMAQPAEEGGACQHVLTGWVYDLCPWFLLCLFQACTVSTTTDCVMVCEGLD